jgi:DNA-binding MarR family transcriptional regulator
MYERLGDAGYPDVTRAQFALFRWPGIDGRRPGEVAELAGLSKQAVNDVLGELERDGYLERDPDPKDGRARIVRLTPGGTRLQRTTHEISRELEATWAEQIGKRRVDALRQALEAMIAASEEDGLKPAKS